MLRMSKKLRDHTDEELMAEMRRRGLMGEQARGRGDPIPVGDPTRPGKQMHDPLEGDEKSGLETPPPGEEDRYQESDGEVGADERDDTGEDVNDEDQTIDTSDVPEGEEDIRGGEANAGQDMTHQTSEDSKEV